MTEQKWLDVSDVLPDTEVELKVHGKGKSWKQLRLDKKENDLLTAEECITLANSKHAKALKMDGSSWEDDFFIQQPFKLNKSNDFVARFVADSVRARLYCGRGPLNTDAVLGVRFKRKKKHLNS